MPDHKAKPTRRLRALARRFFDWLVRWLKSPGRILPGRRDRTTTADQARDSDQVRTADKVDHFAGTQPSGRGPVSTGRPAPVRQTGRARAPSGRLQLLPWVTPARDFVVLSPPQRTGELKLLVMLHGCHQEPDAFARAAGLDALVMRGDWIVLLPAQSRRANLNGCWNWFDTRTTIGAGESAIIVAAIEQVGSQFDIPPAATFIAGMSSGAALAAAVVCHSPQRFGGVAFHSGVGMGATSSPWRARKVLREGPDRDITRGLLASGDVAVLVIHGDQDEVVTPRHADELMRQMLTLNGRLQAGAPLPTPDHIDSRWPSASRDAVPDATTAKVVSDSGGDKSIRVRRFGRHRQVTVLGLAHAWSGGLADEPYFDATAPDATHWINDFFTASARAVQPLDL